MVVVIKKKRRMGGIGNGPPVRLGWLGEGFGLGATTATAVASPGAFQITNDANNSTTSIILFVCVRRYFYVPDMVLQYPGTKKIRARRPCTLLGSYVLRTW